MQPLGRLNPKNRNQRRSKVLPVGNSRTSTRSGSEALACQVTIQLCLPAVKKATQMVAFAGAQLLHALDPMFLPDVAAALWQAQPEGGWVAVCVRAGMRDANIQQALATPCTA